MVAWSLKEPNLVHVLIDAVGERDLPAAHLAALIILDGPRPELVALEAQRGSTKFKPLRVRYKRGAGPGHRRQICVLSFEAALLSTPGTTAHTVQVRTE